MPFLFKNPELAYHRIDGTSSVATTVKGMQYFTAAVDPASIAANSSAETAVTRSGVAVGDIVLPFVPASLEVGLNESGCRVSAANTIQLRLSNHTGVAVDGISRTWEFLWIDLT